MRASLQGRRRAQSATGKHAARGNISGMSVTTHLADCTPAAVFAVLADGWLYPTWVVGASRARAVDADWPTPGASIHHSIGVWPLLINDKTVCTELVPDRLMVLRGRGWPLGEVTVRVELAEAAGGCDITLHEEPVRGPATLIPRLVLDPLLHARNRECLRRLAYLAEGGAR